MFKLQPETLLKPQKRTGTLTDRLNCSLMRTFPQCLPFGRPLVFQVTLHHPNQILSCLQKGFLSNPRTAGIQTYYDILYISTYIYIYLHISTYIYTYYMYYICTHGILMTHSPRRLPFPLRQLICGNHGLSVGEGKPSGSFVEAVNPRLAHFHRYHR
jgi:hypothetical protein